MSAKRIENESEWIRDYLAPLSAGAPLAFGLQDDAAVVRPPDGADLIVTTDPIREGVHFFAADNPADVAWKALAVNVSDIAAKGGRPLAYTMALGLPDAPTHAWARQFTDGLAEGQKAFGCHLIGGDTDRVAGPLSIAITLFGAVPRGRMVPRLGAHPGDVVFVTGTLGDAALGLAMRQGAEGIANVPLTADQVAFLRARYLRPTPRLGLANELVSYARSALDVSDGLLADLSKLVGDLSLQLDVADIPLSDPARALCTSDQRALEAVLSGGCDYEILAAVPVDQATPFMIAAERAKCAVTRLGTLTARQPAEPGAPGSGQAVVVQGREKVGSPTHDGFDHFAR